MVGANVEFAFSSVEAEERFIREYLTEAWERFRVAEFFDRGWFWRYAVYSQYRDGSVGGLVRIVFEGEPSRVVETERERWKSFEGLEDWTVHVPEDGSTLLAQQQAASGERAGELDYRIKPFVTDFILEYYREFEEKIEMIDAAGPNSIYGYWVVLHYFVVLAGYDRTDEIDGSLQMMQNRVRSVAKYQGADLAREQYQRLLEEWESFGEELEEWIDNNQTGKAESVEIPTET